MDDDDDDANEHANGDSKKRKGANTKIPVAIIFEGDEVCLETEIQETVDEAHVQRHQGQNGLLDDHDPWLQDVDPSELFQVDPAFISWMHKPSFSRPSCKDDIAICLRAKEEVNSKEGQREDDRQPLRPAPSQMRLSDEAADCISVSVPGRKT